MSFQPFDSSPPPSGGRTESKRPHLSVFRFTSFQSISRRPSQTPPAYSPNDAIASRNQLHAKILHWLRIAVSAVTFLASIIIIACTARALQTYNNTPDNAHWVLPLWPVSVDLRPTHALLACGVILAVASLFYIAAALAPSVRSLHPREKLPAGHTNTKALQPLRLPRALNIISTTTAFISIFLAIFTTVFASAINAHLSDSTQAGTLESWSCKWQDFGAVTPGNFSDICAESNAAMDVVILMIVVQVFHVLLAGWGWWVGAGLRKAGGGEEGKGEGVGV
ncbi:MAG: hypothetical protein Q9219_000698 [cf. Caloplaca sp. 3 TL-2023]